MKKVVIVLFVLFLGAAAWYFLFMQEPAAEREALPPVLSEQPEPAQPDGLAGPAEETLPKTGLGESLDAQAETAPEPAPLPDLAQSDPMVLESLQAIAGETAVSQYLVPDNLISRLVATIDALSGRQVSANLMPVNPLDTPFAASVDPAPEVGLTTPEGDPLNQYLVDPANTARYAAYVELIESMDMSQLAAAYLRQQPLFEEAYLQQGYPKGGFTARLLEIIDLVLAAPVPAEPLRLVKPEAYYKYVDPELEALSAGQKILLRLGNSNAERVKVKLREFRAALLAASGA
jgi:hypothetical protein